MGELESPKEIERERDGPGCLFGEETGSRDLSGEKQKVLGGPGREHGPGVGVKMAIEKVLVREANVGFGGRGGRDRKEPGILVWSGLWVVRVKVGREMTYYYIRGGGSMRVRAHSPPTSSQCLTSPRQGQGKAQDQEPHGDSGVRGQASGELGAGQPP